MFTCGDLENFDVKELLLYYLYAFPDQIKRQLSRLQTHVKLGSLVSDLGSAAKYGMSTPNSSLVPFTGDALCLVLTVDIKHLHTHLFPKKKIWNNPRTIHFAVANCWYKVCPTSSEETSTRFMLQHIFDSFLVTGYGCHCQARHLFQTLKHI